MRKQPTITDVANTLDVVVGTLVVVVEKVEDLSGAVHDLSSHMDNEFVKVRQEMGQMEGRLRVEMGQMQEGLRQEMGQMKNEMINEIDRFVVVHQKLDHEYVSFLSRFERIESRLERNNIM